MTAGALHSSLPSLSHGNDDGGSGNCKRLSKATAEQQSDETDPGPGWRRLCCSGRAEATARGVL